MTNRPATWKIVTFGAALTGLGATGIGVAAADDDRDRPLPAGVSVPAADAPADAPVDGPVDASPESADSPNESVTDSAALAAYELKYRSFLGEKPRLPKSPRATRGNFFPGIALR